MGQFWSELFTSCCIIVDTTQIYITLFSLLHFLPQRQFLLLWLKYCYLYKNLYCHDHSYSLVWKYWIFSNQFLTQCLNILDIFPRTQVSPSCNSRPLVLSPAYIVESWEELLSNIDASSHSQRFWFKWFGVGLDYHYFFKPVFQVILAYSQSWEALTQTNRKFHWYK